jgi:hypothetical protein
MEQTKYRIITFRGGYGIEQYIPESTRRVGWFKKRDVVVGGHWVNIGKSIQHHGHNDLGYEEYIPYDTVEQAENWLNYHLGINQGVVKEIEVPTNTNPTLNIHTQLLKLSSEELYKVISNTDPKRLSEYMLVECYTVGLALCYLFSFRDTAEGIEYWESVCNKYKDVSQT